MILRWQKTDKVYFFNDIFLLANLQRLLANEGFVNKVEISSH